MGSNHPWSPYNSYKDCSQGVCSIDCPQWCYIVFSPPPPYDLPADSSADSSGAADFSPLIIAIIGILATIFLLVTYFAIVFKYCKQRSSDLDAVSPEFDDFNEGELGQGHQIDSRGLEDAIIKSITVYKYKKRDGFVEGTECAVCLNEFNDDENLRLLPKCDHAFHVPCIDAWLKSNASCPLCRYNIPPTKFIPQQNQLVLQLQAQDDQPQAAPPPQALHQSTETLDVNMQRNDTVINVQELENLIQQEDRRKRVHGISRSFSLDSSLQQGGGVSIADMSHKSEFEGGNLGMERVESDEESNSESRISCVGFGRCSSTGRLLLISKDGRRKEVR